MNEYYNNLMGNNTQRDYHNNLNESLSNEILDGNNILKQYDNITTDCTNFNCDIDNNRHFTDAIHNNQNIFYGSLDPIDNVDEFIDINEMIPLFSLENANKEIEQEEIHIKCDCLDHGNTKDICNNHETIDNTISIEVSNSVTNIPTIKKEPISDSNEMETTINKSIELNTNTINNSVANLIKQEPNDITNCVDLDECECRSIDTILPPLNINADDSISLTNLLKNAPVIERDSSEYTNRTALPPNSNNKDKNVSILETLLCALVPKDSNSTKVNEDLLYTNILKDEAIDISCDCLDHCSSECGSENTLLPTKNNFSMNTNNTKEKTTNNVVTDEIYPPGFWCEPYDDYDPSSSSEIDSNETSNESLKENCNQSEKTGLNAEGNVLVNSENNGASVTNKKRIRDRKNVRKMDYQCDVCGRYYRIPQSLMMHRRIHHKNSPPYKCPDCGKGYDEFKCSLYQHLLTHRHLKPIQCEVCDMKFRLSCTYKKHLYTHLPFKPTYKCDICGKPLASSKSVTKHKLTHLAPGTEVRKYSCDKCSRKFRDRKALRIHLYSHLTRKTVKCEICDMMFVCKRYMIAHMAIHSKKKSFKCDVCGAMFKRKDNLYTHSLIHTDLKPYGCKVCGQRFRRLDNCNKHLTIHSKPPRKRKNADDVDETVKKKAKKVNKNKKKKKKTKYFVSSESDDNNCDSESWSDLDC